MQRSGTSCPTDGAIDAWTELLSRGGDVGAIGRQLAVLAAYAVAVLALAAVRLRRLLIR